MNQHLSIVYTADGTKTIFNSLVNENYHSKHGALQESEYVFLGNGLKHFIEGKKSTTLSILEIGFGTGLNFLLSADYCLKKNIELNYQGIELFPLPSKIISATDYHLFIAPDLWANFTKNYNRCILETSIISEKIKLKIQPVDIADYKTSQLFDIIYFDAFSKIHQPEIWSESIIKHCVSFLKPKGVFVTYAITGDLKRTLQACGLVIEKLPGALGKREMLRATKP